MDFSDRPPRGVRDPPPKRPYHAMTPEERREAWEALRRRQGARARQHHKAPVFFGLVTVALIVFGIVLLHYGVGWGSVLLWASVAFAGFTVIAVLRNLIGALPGRRDDFTPPGF